MRLLLAAGLLIAGIWGASAQGYGTGSNPSSQYVGGYTRQNGTVVEPYHRTTPNGTTYDNYGTRGNYNPYTGEYGHRSPY